ncbi:hypothetical protein Tco_0834289 [Tanacetum coccineum]
MGEADINKLTMEQYLALTYGNQVPGVVKLEIGGNVNFEFNSQFMRELIEDTFSGNKNDDAHEHVEMILDFISLFNILGVTHDAVMLRVFPITLTEAAKRWVDRLPLGTINTWDLLKKAFIQRYCLLSKMEKQLEEIHNFKQEGDETLYQAWERKVSNDSSDGIATIINKLDSLRRDMKKLKENAHAIQVGCETRGGAHLNKQCPLHEEVKNVEEVNFSDEEVQEETEEVEEIKEVAAHHELAHRKVMESLKRIKVNCPLLKEMRQTDDYAKYINNLVVNKSRTSKNEDVNMNTRCSTILQNQLPPKEQDSRSFTLPCSIGKLTFNALADLEASISIMSLSMLKMLGIRELKPINLTIEMANTTKSTPRPALEVLSRSW